MHFFCELMATDEDCLSFDPYVEGRAVDLNVLKVFSGV